MCYIYLAMKGFALNKIISWMMLAYFIVFVIPPVSSITETRTLNLATESSLSKEPRRQQTRLFLIDLLVWHQITQSKRADKLLVSSRFGNADDNADSLSGKLVTVDFVADTFCQEDINRFARPVWQHSTLGHSRLSHIRYACSGISPPHLS